MRHKMKRIQSLSHKTGTCDVSKVFLSCFDDETYILINSLAYLHKHIKS